MYQVKIANSLKNINLIIDLRYTVLREPWNKPKHSVTDDLELSSVNAYIEQNGEVIACGRLQDNGFGIGQVRFMAVAFNVQKKGLGKLIMLKLEEEARRIGIHTIELQARENAVQFYKNLNYEIIEPSFKLWDIIQHYLMKKKLSSIEKSV